MTSNDRNSFDQSNETENQYAYPPNFDLSFLH
jgi:hypothetical protein